MTTSSFWILVLPDSWNPVPQPLWFDYNVITLIDTHSSQQSLRFTQTQRATATSMNMLSGAPISMSLTKQGISFPVLVAIYQNITNHIGIFDFSLVGISSREWGKETHKETNTEGLIQLLGCLGSHVWAHRLDVYSTQYFFWILLPNTGAIVKVDRGIEVS